VPKGVKKGPVKVSATIWYSRLVSSVAQYLKVPNEEYEPVKINAHEISLEIQ
jgi:hypothetical protein